MTKVSELRDLGLDELRRREHDMAEQLFRLRIRKSMGEGDAISKLISLRLDLARVKTLLREHQQSS